jgi:hypothetical protein
MAVPPGSKVGTEPEDEIDRGSEGYFLDEIDRGWEDYFLVTTA